MSSTLGCGAQSEQAPIDGLADSTDGPADDQLNVDPEPEPYPALPPGSALFRDGNVLELDLTLDPADEHHIEERGNDEKYRPAQLTVRGSELPEQSFARVGFRHKGAVSLRRCWEDNGGVRSHAGECQKISYKLKFSEYGNHDLDGLKRLNLHSLSADPAKTREYLGYSIFRDFGVPAPRTVPARVTVNGKLKGLFLAVEEVDLAFVRANFSNAPHGNLYKEIWPVAELTDMDFLAGLETNEKHGDVSLFRTFAEAIQRSTPETFQGEISHWLDVDAVLRYIAVDRAIKSWDGIMAFYKRRSPHNFFFYQEESGRAHLIPWDLDNVLGQFDPVMYPEQWVTAPPVPDWNTEPLDCSRRSLWEAENTTKVTPPRCDPLLDLLAVTQWGRFEQIGAELLAGPFRVEALREKADRFRDLIANLVAEDPVLDEGRFRFEAEFLRQSFERAVSDFQGFVSGGLRREQPPVEEKETLSAEVLDAPTANAGLLPSAVTNFEFAETPESVAGVEFELQSATATARWNTTAPISGRADLLFDFAFVRTPGIRNEAVALRLLSNEMDVSGYRGVAMTLSSDVRRNVRVRIASAAYEHEFQGVPAEFGREVSVSTKPRRIVLPFDTLYYPYALKAGWQPHQGFGSDDAQARSVVLRRFRGLVFAPPPTLNSAEELATEVESGSLRIDNVYLLPQEGP